MQLISTAEWKVVGDLRKLEILDYEAVIQHISFEDPDRPWRWNVRKGGVDVIKRGREGTLMEAKDAAEFAIAYCHKKEQA